MRGYRTVGVFLTFKMAALFTFCLITNCVLGVLGQGSFTNFVNQEKLYTIEDELITISDVILNQERALHGSEDVHGIYDITSVIQAAKTTHKAVVEARNLTAYLSHPINIYHMTKRLVDDWSKVVKKLQESQSCAKLMRVKVQNIEDNLPNKDKLTNVCESILRVQDIHGLLATDLLYWNISGSLPLAPLTLDEAFELARAAYETNQYNLAIDWLTHVTSHYDENEASFSLTNALNQMSSSNFKLNRPKQAVENLETILKKDPDNVAAKRNKKFIEERMADIKQANSFGKSELKSKKEREVMRLCGTAPEQNVTKQSRLFCMYTKERDAGWFTGTRIQTEVLSVRPTILLFHNMTTTSQQKAVQYLGYERMRDQLSKHHYRYPDGLESTWVLDNTRWKWIPKLQKSLETIAISELYPDPSVFMVKNIGMDGFDLPTITKREQYQLGTFVVFLNDLQHEGGEIAFPRANVTVKPSKGSVLFFDVKANRQATFCPVLREAEWVGVYPLMDQMAKDVCHKNALMRPKFI